MNGTERETNNSSLLMYFDTLLMNNLPETRCTNKDNNKINYMQVSVLHFHEAALLLLN